MANSLQPVVYPFSVLRNNMINAFEAQSGVNDTNEGSSIRDFIEAAAMNDFRNQGNIIALLNSQDIDRAQNSDLDKIGYAAGVPRPGAKTASGFVTIGSTTFQKISTTVYAGTAAPPAGSSLINVANGAAFPTTGAIYIGRGTADLEGPLAYSSILPVGNYYQITLVGSTTKNHNTSETVILAQGGNRVVSSGATVQTTPNETTPAVQYTVTTNVTVPDGEVSIVNVPVICNQSGAIGNAASGAINQFGSGSFPGSFVTNPTSFVSGADALADDPYRNLIKASEQTKQRATPLTLETVAVGVTSTDDNKTCTSAHFRPSPNQGQPGILFITSGTGYEPVIYGQGYEPIIDNANGSEQYLQLEHEDLCKATLISTNVAPFALTGNMAIAVEVGGDLSTHIFQATDFATQNAATTDEVVASINNDTSITFSARAVNNDTQIALFAEAYVNEDIRIVPPVSPYTDANEFLGFSTNIDYTLMLYENNILLYKDGVIPTAFSKPQDNWNSIAFTSGCTLVLEVDGTPNTTLTFVDSDFIPYGYNTVAASNSLASWIALINLKTPGITASISGNEIQLVSNKGAITGASLQVVGGTLVTSGNMFAAATYQGRTSDYALNRSTGQLELAKVMLPGSSLSAGSKNTRGFVDSAAFPTGATALAPTANDTAPRLFIILDEPSQIISAPIPTGSAIVVSNPSGDEWTYTSSNVTAFSNVMVDDWVLVTSKNIPDSSGNKGWWRVISATGPAITVQKVAGTAFTYVASGNNDIIIIRSVGMIQEIDFGTGSQTLGSLISSVNSQLVGGFAEAQSSTTMSINTNTYGFNGSIFIAGYNSPASVLGFSVGEQGQSTISPTAFAESLTSELTIPEFVHDFITADNGVVPPPVIDRTIHTNLDLSSQFPPNKIISFLDAYANVSNNTGAYDLIGQFPATNQVLIRGNNEVKDIITNDRYFVAAPYQLSGEDNLVVIIDQDPVNKSLNIPLFRNGVISAQTAPTPTTFTAYDTDNNPTANYAQGFGNNFNFQDFKILFHARQVLNPAGGSNAMVIRFYKFGPTGNQAQVGIFYPRQPNAPVSSAVLVDDKTSIQISLGSGVSKIGGWSPGTQFNVTNIGGNTWQYAWNGTGSSPAFTSALPSAISVGDIITIGSGSNFSSVNQGTFKVTGVTANYFNITNAAGVLQSNVQINTVSDLTFYSLSSGANTSAAILAYINSSLSDYITATALSSPLSGTVTTSTSDDLASPYVPLVNGENWIYSSNIGTTSVPTNQFVLKQAQTALNSSSPSYNFVGEPFRLVPVMTKQIVSFLNIFAVTGLSTLGNLSASSNAGKLQLYSDLFGSAGAIEVTGGTANGNTAAILNSAFIANSNYTAFDISGTESAGLMAGQWVEIENDVTQPKANTFTTSTTLQVVGGSPTVGFSSIAITSSIPSTGSFQTVRTTSADATTQMKVEQQAQFWAISWTGTGTAPAFNNVVEGDWVLIEGAFNSLNQGIYRVIKIYNNTTIYIQSEDAIAETVTLSGNSDLSFYSYDSVMPGDIINIENNLLGINNNGSFTVVYNPGASIPFPSQSTIHVSGGLVNNGPTALGANFGQFTINEETPFLAFRKIVNVVQDPSNINDYTVVVTGTALDGKINVNVGSSINLVGKFGFNNLINTGADSYKYFGGLIHAVGEVVRGEPFDPITFPGYAAAGAYFEVDASLPLPIQLSIVIRVVTGSPFALLQSRVQSVVASYVNSLGINQPVVFSEIVAAAQTVAGVQAVSIASPTYNDTHDIIVVGPNEQAVIENATTDIVVSLAT